LAKNRWELWNKEPIEDADAVIELAKEVKGWLKDNHAGEVEQLLRVARGVMRRVQKEMNNAGT